MASLRDALARIFNPRAEAAGLEIGTSALKVVELHGSWITPGIVDMQWFELLRPTERKKSTFEEKYKDRVSPMGFELLQAMFLFDPNARPTAADVLEHPFFTSEAPMPKRAEALKELEGDWHEFESKALRKEKEKQDKEARRVAREEKDSAKKDEGKRRADAAVGEERDAKRTKSGDVTA